MADIGGVKADLAAFEGAQKTGLQNAFTYVLNNLSLLPTDRGRAINMQLYYKSGITSSNANAEFSIAHGLERAPTVLFPAVTLNEVGARIVPLEVTRAADAKRVYLKSSSTSAPITILVG